MIADPKFNTAKEWFEKLRDNLVETIQNIDEKQFEVSNWDHRGDGGGKIIAVGTPEELAEHPTSHTGKFLKEMLTKSNINNEVKLVKAS